MNLSTKKQRYIVNPLEYDYGNHFRRKYENNTK